MDSFLLFDSVAPVKKIQLLKKQMASGWDGSVSKDDCCKAHRSRFDSCWRGELTAPPSCPTTMLMPRLAWKLSPGAHTNKLKCNKKHDKLQTEQVYGTVGVVSASPAPLL